MPIASGNWADTLAAVGERVAVECANGIPVPDDETGGLGGAGGFPVDVDYGDDSIGPLQKQGRGRVVLTIARADGSASVVSNANIEVLCQTLPVFEAHIWAPTARVAKLDRIRAISKLVSCVVRAIAFEHRGGQATANIKRFEAVEFSREIELFRHGQSAILTFIVPTPISVGKPTRVLEGDSQFGTPGDPGQLADPSNIIINEET